jgi:hypothetical protein
MYLRTSVLGLPYYLPDGVKSKFGEVRRHYPRNSIRSPLKFSHQRHQSRYCNVRTHWLLHRYHWSILLYSTEYKYRTVCCEWSAQWHNNGTMGRIGSHNFGLIEGGILMTSQSLHVGPMVKNPERPRIVAPVQHRRTPFTCPCNHHERTSQFFMTLCTEVVSYSPPHRMIRGTSTVVQPQGGSYGCRPGNGLPHLPQ